MNKGHRCSLQYHEKKHETIYVLKGKLKIFYGETVDKLSQKIYLANETISLEPGLIHRMEAVEDSKKVNEKLVDFLEKFLKEQKKNKPSKNVFTFSDEEINSLFNMQKENIVNIFRNNSRINHNRKVIQNKIVEVDSISKKAQDLVANFHELLYKDD